MSCEQLVVLAEIALLAKALAVLCFSIAGSVVLATIWLWCKP